MCVCVCVCHIFPLEGIVVLLTILQKFWALSRQVTQFISWKDTNVRVTFSYLSVVYKYIICILSIPNTSTVYVLRMLLSIHFVYVQIQFPRLPEVLRYLMTNPVMNEDGRCYHGNYSALDFPLFSFSLQSFY